MPARLRYLSRSQRLSASLFVFASLSDRDGYVRPTASYAVDDHWTDAAGANVFVGRESHTFFGQLENNSNAYLALRYAR